MGADSWHLSLRDLLSGSRPDGQRLRVVVLGVGNDLNADDGAGGAVTRAVAAALPPEGPWLAIEGGAAPENATGAIRRFRPDVVLMVDAVRMGEPAGSVHCIPWDDVDGFSASSHTLPLTILADYLRQELSCRVELLGIQVHSLELDELISEPVSEATVDVVNALVEASKRW